MTSISLDFHRTSFSPKSFPISPIDSFKSTKTVFSPPVDPHFESSKSSIETLHKILKRLAGLELPGQEHFEAYLRYVCRRNRRPRTVAIISISLVLFLGVIKKQGKTCIEEITKEDVAAFIEHEQDRGIMITTIRTKLVCVPAPFSVIWWTRKFYCRMFWAEGYGCSYLISYPGQWIPMIYRG